MSNNFCKYLSNGYSFSIDKTDNAINVRPCCLFRTNLKLDDQLETNRARYNSITDWTPDCVRCQFLEKSGQQSLRQASFDWITQENHNNPVSIDIFLDNTCNAACATCNELGSTLWYKEKQKLINQSFRVEPDTDNIDIKINKIIESFDYSDLRYIKFFGGEPLFTDTHLKFLKRIPNPENVTVHYTTNGSIFPSKDTLAVWSKFKTIIFAVSIDGVNQQFNYIRWPTSWKKVSDNLLRLNKQKLRNVMFRVEFTINFLNAWYFDQVEEWVQNNLPENSFGDSTELNIHHCTGGTFDLHYMPVSLRKEILQKYPQEHRVHNMIANLEQPVEATAFNEFTAQWDQRRNQHWQQAFSEISHHFTCPNTKKIMSTNFNL